MNFSDLIKSITPEIHANLKTAIELGKWPNGNPLTQEQKEQSLQAVIAYEAEHLDETERVGYIDASKKKKPKSDHEALTWVD